MKVCDKICLILTDIFKYICGWITVYSSLHWQTFATKEIVSNFKNVNDSLWYIICVKTYFIEHNVLTVLKSHCLLTGHYKAISNYNNLQYISFCLKKCRRYIARVIVILYGVCFLMSVAMPKMLVNVLDNYYSKMCKKGI